MGIDAAGAPTKGSRTTAHPVRDVAVATAATTVASLPVFLVSTLAVQMRSALHFGESQLGIAVTLAYLGAAIWSVPSGRIAERFGGVRVLRVTPFLGGLTLGAIGVYSHSFMLLAMLMVPAGMISASTATATNLFLAKRADPKWQGLIFGIKQSAVPLAAIVGGVSVPVVALTVGWRYAFVGAGVLAILVGLSVPRPSMSLATRKASTTDTSKVRLPYLALSLLGSGLGLGVFAASGFSAFLVIDAVHLGIAKGPAGLVAAAAGASAVIVRVVTGIVADRRGGKHFRAVSLMMSAGVVGYAVLAIGSVIQNRPLFVVGAVLALGAGWGWNGLFNFAVIRASLHAPARATGVTQVGGRLGGMLGPVVIGLFAGNGDYSAAWFFCAATLGAGAIAIVVGRRLLVSGLRT